MGEIRLRQYRYIFISQGLHPTPCKTLTCTLYNRTRRQGDRDRETSCTGLYTDSCKGACRTPLVHAMGLGVAVQTVAWFF